MKKTKLFKSLLVAAGLTMGASAWAQTSTLMEYGTGDVAWSAENLAEWTAGGNPTISGDYVEISGGNGSYATSKTIAPTANAIINVQAVWRGRSNTGRAFSAGNGSYFRFGNIIVAQNDQDQKHGYGFAGLDNISSVSTFTAGSYRVEIASSTWLLIDMEINTASNTLTSFTIKSEDGTTTYVSQSNVALSEADYTTVAFGYRKAGSVKTTNTEDLKSVKITETIQSVETADYTVKYVCNGAEVKDAATRTGVVGDNIALNASDTEDFYANDKKYIYVSSDVDGKTVAEGAVVTITFREAATYNWTAKSSVGTYTISGTAFEGDKASAKYPLYVLVEGKLWTKGATDKVFAQSFDVTADNQEFTLEYTETDIDNVVFLAEVEDISGMSVVNSGNAEARSSQRAAGYSADGKTAITSLPAGKYTMNARFFSPTSAGGHYYFYAGNRQIFETTTDNSNATDVASEAFVLAQTSNDILLGQTGASAAVDFIYIQSAGTPTDEELAEAAAADVKADKAARVFNIIGIGNDWDTDHQMTQSSVDGEEDIYTFTTTLRVVGGEASNYFEYKLRQNSDWEGYQLPASGEGNYSWEDQVDGIGIYTLEFTADVDKNTLNCVATKTDFEYAVVGCTYDGSDEVASALFSAGAWDTNTTDVMTKQTDGSFVWKTKATLPASWIDLKVIARDGSDVAAWFGNNGANVGLNINETGAGTYFVTVSFNGSNVTATAVKEETYTVAGCYDTGSQEASFFGTAWDEKATANNMTYNDESGLYELSFKDVALTKTGTITYKVTKDNAWDIAYPGSNATWGVVEAGTYDITFTFNPNTEEVACNMAIQKEITSAGYATYCSHYILSFDVEGLTAYKATKSGTKVSFEAIDDAPANTGVLLKGEPKTYSLPIIGSSSANVSDNVLIGVLEATEVSAGSFVLLDGTEGVGFYNTVNPFTVGANTAYIAGTTGGARSFIGFSGETTAIEGVASAEQQSSVVYDLQGRRVMNAKKGLYIVNGKKVILK